MYILPLLHEHNPLFQPVQRCIYCVHIIWYLGTLLPLNLYKDILCTYLLWYMNTLLSSNLFKDILCTYLLWYKKRVHLAMQVKFRFFIQIFLKNLFLDIGQNFVAFKNLFLPAHFLRYISANQFGFRDYSLYMLYCTVLYSRCTALSYVFRNTYPVK